MTAKKRYRPGGDPDNVKAIAQGELQVLVDYLLDLGELARRARPAPPLNPNTPNSMLLERAQYGREYAAALQVRLDDDKKRGRPRDFSTAFDAVRALGAALEYERLKGTRPALRLEEEILKRYDISRAALRAARKGKLPDIGWPGIPSAGK